MQGAGQAKVGRASRECARRGQRSSLRAWGDAPEVPRAPLAPPGPSCLGCQPSASSPSAAPCPPMRRVPSCGRAVELFAVGRASRPRPARCERPPPSLTRVWTACAADRPACEGVCAFWHAARRLTVEFGRETRDRSEPAQRRAARPPARAPFRAHITIRYCRLV